VEIFYCRPGGGPLNPGGIIPGGGPKQTNQVIFNFIVLN